MKRIASTLFAALMTMTLLGTAHAGPRHHDHDYRGGYQVYQNDRHHAGPRHPYRAPRHTRHHHHNDWIGPAAVLAIGGLAIGAALHHEATQPTYSAPPPPPPSGSWYLCRSSGQYYPYTQACPEGWQAVRPR